MIFFNQIWLRSWTPAMPSTSTSTSAPGCPSRLPNYPLISPIWRPGWQGRFFFYHRLFFPEPTISRLGDQFLCTDCEALCDSLEAIANHMNRDHKKRSDQWENKKYKCEQCIVPFSFKSTWLTHMQRKHGTHFAFKCNYCDYKCNRKAQVTSHVEEAHKLTASPGVRQGFKCRICGVIFLTKEPLISHIKTIHSDVMQTQSQSHQAPQNKTLEQLNTTFAQG